MGAMERTDLDAAYMAGFFDGEGCVSIVKHTNRKRRSNPVYVLRVDIDNTDPGVIEFVKAFAGDFGSAFLKRKATVFPAHMAVYSFRCHSYEAYHFLRLIYPYVRVKRKQVELAFRFQQYKDRYSSGTGHPQPLGVLVQMDKDHLEIKRLKKVVSDASAFTDTTEESRDAQLEFEL